MLGCQRLDYPRTHDLFQLVGASGMFGISPLALDLAMCSPSVRYEADGPTLKQAVDAHHASLDICRDAVEGIAKIGQRKADQRPEWAKAIDR